MGKQRTRQPRLDKNLQEKSSLVKGEQLLRLSTKSLAAKSLAVQRGCQKKREKSAFSCATPCSSASFSRVFQELARRLGRPTFSISQFTR